jgi:hypothetical protein
MGVAAERIIFGKDFGRTTNKPVRDLSLEKYGEHTVCKIERTSVWSVNRRVVESRFDKEREGK